MLKRSVVRANLSEAEVVVVIDDNNRIHSIEGIRDYGDLSDDFEVIEEIEELE